MFAAFILFQDFSKDVWVKVHVHKAEFCRILNWNNIFHCALYIVEKLVLIYDVFRSQTQERQISLLMVHHIKKDANWDPCFQPKTPWRNYLSLNLSEAEVDKQSGVSLPVILIGATYPPLQAAWSALHVRPGRTYLTAFLLQCHHNKFHTVLETGRGGPGREGGIPGCRLGPFSSPCKVFTISLTVVSLSRKWGQRITWRGGKGPEVERLLFGGRRTFPRRLPREERYFFFLFVVKPTVISRLQWGETWKREEEKKNARPFAGPEPFQMRARLLFLQPCQERSPN